MDGGKEHPSLTIISMEGRKDGVMDEWMVGKTDGLIKGKEMMDGRIDVNEK